jgi:hypothetical protein
MSALIRENDTFEVKIIRSTGKDGKETFMAAGSKAVLGEELTFVFKRPAWGDTKTIMSRSVRFVDGKGEIDPYMIMDSRIKVLLKKWNLQDDDGKPIPATPENVERLPSALVEAIHGAMNDHLE